MLPPPPSNPNPSASPNIIKRLFYKYTDLPEQNYSEKSQIALKIMDILYKTEQCDKKEYQEVKDLVQYTYKNLNYSVFQLDMMVNPNDRLPYDTSKYHFKKMTMFLDKERIEKTQIEWTASDIQETLLITMHKISEILNTILLRAKLLDFWAD